jgi:hypothetical protein
MTEKKTVRIKHRDRRMLGRNITTSEKVNSISDRDFRIWTYLLVSADDDGRIEGSPLTVKMTCLPGLPYSVEDVSESLQRLHDIGLIIWYEVGGRLFIQVCQWDDHQRFHGFTRYPSIYPSPNGSSAATSPEGAETGEAGSPETPETGDTNRQEIRDKGQEIRGKKRRPRYTSPSTRAGDEDCSPPERGDGEQAEVDKGPACFDENTLEYKLSSLLRQLILANNPKANVPPATPKRLVGWAKAINDLMRLQDKDPREIKDVIQFSQQDSFWHQHVLSGDKLKKHYDKVFLKMKSEGGRDGERHGPQTYDSPQLGRRP